MIVSSYNPSGINITDDAVEYLSKHTKTGYILLEFKASGCSGLKYHINEVDPTSIDDSLFSIFPFGDIYIAINHYDLDDFKGIQLKYVKNGLNTELVFENPNTHNSCGCGESFSIKKK